MIEVGRMIIYKDGRIDVINKTPAEAFMSDFGTFSTNEDIEVSSILNDTYETWQRRTIKTTSPMLLEAYILEQLEYRHDYNVTPVIDFNLVK